MSDRYILDGKTPVQEPDLMKWAAWYETAKRIVKRTEKDEVKVSTIFLGLDYNFGGEGDPILFETMVFGEEHDGDMNRYSTWEKAEKGYEEMVEKVFSDDNDHDCGSEGGEGGCNHPSHQEI